MSFLFSTRFVSIDLYSLPNVLICCKGLNWKGLLNCIINITKAQLIMVFPQDVWKFRLLQKPLSWEGSRCASWSIFTSVLWPTKHCFTTFIFLIMLIMSRGFTVNFRWQIVGVIKFYQYSVEHCLVILSSIICENLCLISGTCGDSFSKFIKYNLLGIYILNLLPYGEDFGHSNSSYG